jgi:mRNA interferase MazF
MRRGDVWLVDLDPTMGHEQNGGRPALIISADELNLSPVGLVAVLPMTSKARKLPSRVRIAPPAGGLAMESWVICEQIRTVSKQRLVTRLGRVTPATLGAVVDIVKILLAFD